MPSSPVFNLSPNSFVRSLSIIRNQPSDKAAKIYISHKTRFLVHLIACASAEMSVDVLSVL